MNLCLCIFFFFLTVWNIRNTCVIIIILITVGTDSDIHKLQPRILRPHSITVRLIGPKPLRHYGEAEWFQPSMNYSEVDWFPLPNYSEVDWSPSHLPQMVQILLIAPDALFWVPVHSGQHHLDIQLKMRKPNSDSLGCAHLLFSASHTYVLHS